MKEREALEMLPRAQPHRIQIYFPRNSGLRIDRISKVKQDPRHLVKNLLARSLPVKFALLRIGIHLLIEKLPDGLLEHLVILSHPPQHAR
jgi:hypothetical protein